MAGGVGEPKRTLARRLDSYTIRCHFADNEKVNPPANDGPYLVFQVKYSVVNGSC